MKKQKYFIDKEGEKVEVEGYVSHDGKWGIDKRDNQYYVLTHIKTGYLVWSSKTLSFLKKLLQEPEFFEDQLTAGELGQVIKRFCQKNGWA